MPPATLKPILITLFGIILIAAITLFGMKQWIGKSVESNIEKAQSLYSGEPEDALIAFLQDTLNSPHERTHLAIWTLGQIESEKALPFLKDLYKNDPEGNTCYKRHSERICQYELHKAIQAIESNKQLTYAKLKFK